jgi:hypothetical protein
MSTLALGNIPALGWHNELQVALLASIDLSHSIHARDNMPLISSHQRELMLADQIIQGLIPSIMQTHEIDDIFVFTTFTSFI